MTKVHICAFNADEYKQSLDPLFPGIRISIGRSYNDLGEGVDDCEVLIAFGPILNDRVFQRNKKLKWVQSLGTGVDGIFDQPSLSPEIPITSMRGIHGPQMSELAFLLMLALNRNFPKILDNQKQHSWDRWPGLILEHKSIGIWGVGTVAGALAKRCKAFDMKVIGFTRTAREVQYFDQIVDLKNVLSAIRQLDYLVVLAPYTPENEGIVNSSVFSEMKESAYIINLARGKVVDDKALIQALKNGEIAGAGLDVFTKEPLPSSSPLWDLDNVIITPHMGGMSESYVRQAMPVLEHNLKAYLENDYGRMLNKVVR